METAFAKTITDLNGRDHILIEGRLISLYGPTDQVNEVVAAITRGLRNASSQTMVAGGTTQSVVGLQAGNAV